MLTMLKSIYNYYMDTSTQKNDESAVFDHPRQELVPNNDTNSVIGEHTNINNIIDNTIFDVPLNQLDSNNYTPPVPIIVDISEFPQFCYREPFMRRSIHVDHNISEYVDIDPILHSYLDIPIRNTRSNTISEPIRNTISDLVSDPIELSNHESDSDDISRPISEFTESYNETDSSNSVSSSSDNVDYSDLHYNIKSNEVCVIANSNIYIDDSDDIDLEATYSSIIDPYKLLKNRNTNKIVTSSIKIIDDFI